MLKQLRTKFVCINMVIVAAMLLVIFALVIHFTAQSLEAQSLQTLQSIAASPRLARPEDGEMNLSYFSAQVSPWGEVRDLGGFYDFSDKDKIISIIQAAVDDGQTTGELEQYALRYYRTENMMGLTFVFADISGEEAAIRTLIYTCAGIGIVSLLLFFCLSLLLARWAVKPVANAWEQQRQFVADASHELKTPLTVIITNAELLQSPEYGEAERQQFTSSILTMSHQMRGLVQSLLELARVDNGAVKTAFEELDLSTLVSDELLPFEPMYFEKGLQLETRIEEGIRVRGSASHLAQVVKILLDNAMKYSDPQGTVWLELTKQGSHCTLAVASPGEAISKEDLKNIFKRFYRIDKARSRDGSYGLGLSIAQSIVQDHKGRIWADSTGGYNRFFVQLNCL